MPSLAIVILTYNEEQRLGKCIQLAQKCTSEIIVLDSGSTDATLNIAEQLGAKVCVRPIAGDFAAQRNFALSKTQADYVFYLDADEFLTAELTASIKKAVATGTPQVYSLKRQNIAFGQKVFYGVLIPDYVPRIFPRGSVQWQGKVHEKPIYNLPTQKLDGYLWHETYSSWPQYWRKFDNYTTIWAEQAWLAGKRTSALAAFNHAMGAFFKVFILKRGFMDGFIGIALCCFHFAYTLAKYTKLYSKQQETGGIK